MNEQIVGPMNENQKSPFLPDLVSKILNGTRIHLVLTKNNPLKVDPNTNKFKTSQNKFGIGE